MSPSNDNSPTPASGWLALSIRLAPSADEVAVDVASGELYALGAEGIERRDGPPIELVASFVADEPPEVLIGRAQRDLQHLPVDDVRVDSWPDVDWSTHWRRHFRPLSFGGLWVVPKWLEAPPDAQVVLRIDPGMAFGTGLHPTTALVLERIVELSPLDYFLDIGTGTGILALGAAALGAFAEGTDIDPIAVEAATANAVENGLAKRAAFRVADGVDASDADEPFPLVAANILAEPLIALAPRIAGRVAPEGRLLLSGILVSQGDAVRGAYEACGLTFVRTQQRDEWVSLELLRIA